jgi:hypothetical protein
MAIPDLCRFRADRGAKSLIRRVCEWIVREKSGANMFEKQWDD